MILQKAGYDIIILTLLPHVAEDNTPPIYTTIHGVGVHVRLLVFVSLACLFACLPACRLTLPHEVGGEDDDGSCKAVYDPADDHGTITVTLRKASQVACYLQEHVRYR